MKLDEVALNTCWIVVHDGILPEVLCTYVFTPSKGSEAYQLWKRCEEVRHGALDTIQLRSRNGFHLVMVGRLVPDEVYYVGFTRAQADRYIAERASVGDTETYEAIEIEPDDPTLSDTELQAVIKRRWDEYAAS